MSNAEDVEERHLIVYGEQRHLFVTVPGDVPNPVLLSADHKKIKDGSGGQVHVRVRDHNGDRKLLCKYPATCEEAVLEAARLQAIEAIRYNREIFP